MAVENDYLIKKIIECLSELETTFKKYSNNLYIEYFHDVNEETQMYMNEQNEELKGKFENISFTLFNLLFLYLEKNNLKEYMMHLKSELKIYYEDKNKLHETDYIEEIEKLNNKFLFKIKSLLSGFIELNNKKYFEEYLLSSAGIYYLKNILKGTAVIMNSIAIENESTINREMRRIITTIFPDASYPSEPFIKTAKQYKPDILIPSLKCAIEYKYATDETKLIKTIEEILIDVDGYSNNDKYIIFFAVFYVSVGVISEERFNKIWAERKFPKNWQGLIIFGK